MSLCSLAAYLLASMGLTILIVWPENGPGYWIREKVLRRMLPKGIEGVLDCYLCLGFWAGLLLSVPWWVWYHEPSIWAGCLMVPALFWITMGLGRSDR